MEKRTPFFLTHLLRRNSQKTESSEDKGWGNSIDETRFNGWGSSIGSTSSEPITNGWADESPKDHFNGWGPTSSSSLSHRPPNLEKASNEWTLEKPKDEYNRWVFGSTSGSSSCQGLNVSIDESHASRPQQVESWVPTIPTAPPLPDNNFDYQNNLIMNVLNKDTISSNEGKNNDALCVVCWESQVEGACVPCGHMSSCMACLHEIESKQGTCPICRANIEKVIRIYAN